MKKQFDWDKFKTEKIAVHCKTKEEAKDFCRNMHEHGMKWSDGYSYLDYTNYNNYKDKTYYLGNGCFCSYEYCKRNEYTILEWSDYMSKEFTKADLKDGMIVKYRNGEMYLKFGGKLINNDGFEELSTFDNNLKDVDFSSDYDIMKIYKLNLTKVYCFKDIFTIENIELIWERDVTKHMTADEMRQKLEDLIGEKIEVEPSRNEMIGVLTKYCSGNDRCDLCCIRKECEKNGKYDFWYYSTESLKQCYEKVIADGK